MKTAGQIRSVPLSLYLIMTFADLYYALCFSLRVPYRFISASMITDSISDNKITVIHNPAVAGFDGGFVVDTGELIRDDDIVIHRCVIVPVRVDVVCHIRLDANELDLRIFFLCLSDSGGKQAVKLTHCASIEYITVVLDCLEDDCF